MWGTDADKRRHAVVTQPSIFLRCIYDLLDSLQGRLIFFVGVCLESPFDGNDEASEVME